MTLEGDVVDKLFIDNNGNWNWNNHENRIDLINWNHGPFYVVMPLVKNYYGIFFYSKGSLNKTGSIHLNRARLTVEMKKFPDSHKTLSGDPS